MNEMTDERLRRLARDADYEEVQQMARELLALRKLRDKVLQEYEDAADWKDAIVPIQALAQAALSQARGG